MEHSDRELIMKVLKTNSSLKRLYREHESLEDRLLKMQRKAFLLPREELEVKRLKQKKLRGVDQMMRIISRHKSNADAEFDSRI